MSCFCRGIEVSDASSSCCCAERSGYERVVSCAAKASPPAWKALWTIVKREKRRLFDCSSSATHVVPYDPHSYSQNFDPGSDPENLSRSFSARFAVPSRVFLGTSAGFVA